MMKITLIRHAKVLLDNQTKVSASQMKAWVDEYNHAPIDKTKPSQDLIALVQNANVLIASSLSRSNDSLGLIDVVPSEKNSLFDEVDLPSTNGTFIKFHAKIWLRLLRMMLLLRIGKKSQVLVDAKQRAKIGAEHLMALAKENGTVVLMGHGGMNWLLGKALAKLGWVCVEQRGGNQNWGYQVYEPKS